MSIDPKLEVKNLLRDKWGDSGDYTLVTPDFSTGWWDANNDLPQVTVTNDDETPNPLTETGQTHIGSNTDQNMSGRMDVNVWANRDSSDTNPKKLVKEMRDEAKRIIQKYTFYSDFNYLGWGGSTDMTDTDRTPVTYRKVCEVRYGRIY